MAHARATIGTANYETSIVSGSHEFKADEGPDLGGKNTGPAPSLLNSNPATASGRAPRVDEVNIPAAPAADTTKH